MFSVLYPKFNTDPGSRIRIPYIKPATFLDLSFLNKFETDFRNQYTPQLRVLYLKFNTDPGSRIRIPFFKPATYPDLSFLNKFETDFSKSNTPPPTQCTVSEI